MRKKHVAKSGDFLIFEVKKKFELKEKKAMSRAEPSRAEQSRAENTSARAMARASAARTHHKDEPPLPLLVKKLN